MRHNRTQQILAVMLAALMVLGSFQAVFADQPNRGTTKHKRSLRNASVANAPNKYEDAEGNEQDTDKNTVSINFTSDMEQNMELYAKASTYFKEENAHYPRSFLIDAGNYSQGTPFGSVFAHYYPGIAAMGKAGYDIAGIGASEASQGCRNLTAMLNSASKSNDTLPYITSANIAGTNELDKAYKKYGVNDYLDMNKYRTEIAVISVVGNDAFDAAAPEQLRCEDAAKTVKKLVKEIKDDEDADMIICLCSSGLQDEDDDKILEKRIAKAAGDIDIIISVGSTTELEKPMKVGNTRIYSLDAGGNKLGRIEYVIENNSYKYSGYSTVELEEYKEDKAVKTVLDKARKASDKNYYAANGFASGQKLCDSFFEIAPLEDNIGKKGDSPLGELIADAYRFAATEDAKIPKGNVIAISSDMSALKGIGEGKVIINDVYDMMCSGKSEDGSKGQALVSFYLTGEDVRKLAELSAISYADEGTVRTYFSGLSYKYNPHRFKDSRVYDITTIEDATGSQIDLKDDTIYRCITDSDTAAYIPDLGMEEHPELCVIPKDENGDESLEFSKLTRAADKEKALKTWIAAAEYLATFTEAGIPATYKEPDGRMVYDDSKAFSHVYKGQIGTLAMLAVVALIGIMAAFVLVLLILNLAGVSIRRKKKK